MPCPALPLDSELCVGSGWMCEGPGARSDVNAPSDFQGKVSCE